METDAIAGPVGLGVMVLYAFGLLVVGWLGHKARREQSLADFYLAGHSIGLVTLFLTLYATQYSGSTLVGFAANAYRQGFTFLVSVTFMMGIVGVYGLFAPRLHGFALNRGYITPGDYIQDRYRSTGLTLLLNLIFVITLANYILANLKAVGHVVEVVSGGIVPFGVSIMILSVIMVVYESLGGMRSVAWTDVIQGLILLAGCILIFTALGYRYGGFVHLFERLQELRPDFWEPPGIREKLSWLSILIMVSFGAAVYPQALQRIYAARDARTLRRSFQLLLVMPLMTTLFVLIIGITGVVQFPSLDRVGSEQITLLLLTDLANAIPGLRLLLVLFVAAVMAAIMSTVDSALLTISSIFAQDLYRPLRPNTSQAHLTYVGKLFSWVLMAIMALLAIYLPQTIWKLTVFKLELLVQASPAIILGVRSWRPQSLALIGGVIAGVVVTVALKYGADFGLELSGNPLGLHAGLWGLLANVGVLIGLHAVKNQSRT